MSIRLAFMGFRHGHILDLYRRATEMAAIKVVAACESDEATRETITAQGTIRLTHESFAAMLDQVDCDAVAIGDYFARRGSLIIQALSHNKHVICDKPLCTSLDELNEIERLSAERNLKVDCMLDMRDSAPFITARKLIRQGIIGEIHAVTFGGQHPLLLGKRPAWYFEPGKHGGTINDIAIHAVDAIPWITGLRFKTVNTARCWNAFARDFPHFEDAGQMMLTMDNGCGILGDVSYMAPDSSGYTLPFYWRMTFWGRLGVIETSSSALAVTIALNGEKGARQERLLKPNPGGYLRAFVHDVEGNLDQDALCTGDALRAARIALTIQKAAATHEHNVPLE
ncbi:MAG: Gfo/Idh/MocA family oxidoreductase [Anaerolineales bacterium]|nr:MAG: Gfo/Idh/MocA family oxidoreductase [Anaerolineales bacterium]